MFIVTVEFLNIFVPVRPFINWYLFLQNVGGSRDDYGSTDTSGQLTPGIGGWIRGKGIVFSSDC